MSGSITDVVNRLRQSDPDAPYDLEQALQPLLLEMLRRVRRKRDNPLTARIDSEAVVYAALNSFLTGVPRGEFPVLRDRVDVKRVLTTLVDRALLDQIKWHTREKRTPYREQPCDDALPEPAGPDDPLVQDMAGLLEKLHAAVRGVHPRAIDIVILKLEGLANNDVKEELGLGLRTVQKILQDMRTAWEKVKPREG